MVPRPGKDRRAGFLTSCEFISRGNTDKWVRMSNASPCPICKEPDWCSVSADVPLPSASASPRAGHSRRRRTRMVRNITCIGSTARHRRHPAAAPVRPPTGPATPTPFTASTPRGGPFAAADAHRDNLRARGLGDDESTVAFTARCPSTAAPRWPAPCANNSAMPVVQSPVSSSRRRATEAGLTSPSPAPPERWSPSATPPAGSWRR